MCIGHVFSIVFACLFVKSKWRRSQTTNAQLTSTAIAAKTEGNSYRSDVGRYIYEDIVGKMAEVDLAKLSESTIKTINQLVGSPKVLHLTFNKPQDKRAMIDVKTGQLTVTWNAEYVSIVFVFCVCFFLD
jgi:hypothetical protein